MSYTVESLVLVGIRQFLSMFEMSAKNSNELIERYEQMLNGAASYYFDTDEIDEISDYYESKGQLPKSLNAIEFGLKLHPDNEGLKLKQARYLLYLDRAEEAKKIMSKLADYSPDATLVRAELLFIDSRIEEAHALMLSLLDSDDIREDICFDAMDIYADYDYFDELLEFVAKAETVLPDSKDLLREIAAICEERMEYEQAVVFYNKLIDKDPYSLSDWFSLAKVEALLKHYDKAIEACDFALAVKENDESILSFKGYCYYDSGQYEKAIDQFMEYAAVTKDKSVAYELIGECYIKKNDFDNALAFFHRALDLDPANSNICYQLATCYYDLGRLKEAIVYLQDTLSLDERDDEAHSFLGEILLKEGDYDRAYRHLTRSLELNQDDKETLRLKGEACLHLEYYGEAAEVFESVLQTDAYDLASRFNLVVAYARNGNEAEAERQIAIIDNMSHTFDFGDLPREEQQQWAHVQEAIQSLKDFLLKNIDPASNRDSLS